MESSIFLKKMVHRLSFHQRNCVLCTEILSTDSDYTFYPYTKIGLCADRKPVSLSKRGSRRLRRLRSWSVLNCMCWCNLGVLWKTCNLKVRFFPVQIDKQLYMRIKMTEKREDETFENHNNIVSGHLGTEHGSPVLGDHQYNFFFQYCDFFSKFCTILVYQ